MAGRSKIIVALFLLLAFLPSKEAYAEEKGNYEADSIKYEKAGKRFTLFGNVRIEIQGFTITGEEIVVDLEDKIVFTEKPFQIKTKKDGKETEIKGGAFDFNINNKRIVTKNSSLVTDAQAPGKKVFISGEEITIYREGERISVLNGDFTTCDYIEEKTVPHYNLKAAIIDFYPNERVIAWNTSVYVMGGKTFWFPFWYVPLRVDYPELNLDVGKNSAEGMFVNFKNYYQLNDYHDGSIFTRLMEQKWLGLGFEHTWLALPSSASYVYAYGNLFNSRYFQEADQTLKGNISPLLEDREIYLRHEQNLPFLPNSQLNLTLNDRKFYNINSILAARDDFNEYKIDFSDKELFQPTKDLVFGFDPTFNASYRQQRDTTIGSDRKLTYNNENNVLNLSTNTNLRLNEANLSLDSRYANTIRNTLFRDQNNLASSPNSYYKSADTIDFNNTMNFRTNVLPDLALNGTIRYNNNDVRNFNQPAAVGQAPIQTSNDTQKQQLNSQLSLVQNLGWGNLSLNVDHFNDFLQDEIFLRDKNGSIIPDTQLTPEQLQQRNNSLNKRKGNSYINKLPELTLNVNPLFSEFLPVNVSGSVGRYFEAASFSLKSGSTQLTDIVRSEFALDLGSKELDFGLGNKINFGGSGYKQRFYQTQDAQYSVTGQFNYRNDLLPFFIPQLSYLKVITDSENNTPFSFDRLSRDKRDQLTGNLDLFNIPEFKLRFSNFGYDYQNKSFLNPIGLSLSSDFLAGARFSLSAQSGYTLKNVSQTDLNRPNQNYQNKETLQNDLNNSQLSADAFSKKYAGYSKTEAQSDLNTFNENQLKAKYGIDNRLYDVDGKEVVDQKRLIESDIGKFYLKGGRLNPINFSFGVATPWEFGSDSFFGKEADIPWGIAAKVDTNFNLFADSFYQPNKNGVGDTLNFSQNLANFNQKFQNTSLGALFVFGGNWLSHTHVELNLTLIPPELLPVGSVSKQTNRPFFPFNTVLSVKKDLHDFILSLDLQEQYVPANNKLDFMFSINLEMTAFPFSTKDLTGASRNIGNLTNQMGGF